MGRRELIEIIYEVRKRETALAEENEALKQQLADKQLKAEQAGSLAELSAALNGLFGAAQATADQYLAQIRQDKEYAEKLKAESIRLAQLTLEERKRALAQTEAQCRRMREEANSGAPDSVPAQEGDSDGNR